MIRWREEDREDYQMIRWGEEDMGDYQMIRCMGRGG
jgi:hypothetical protein